MSVGPRPRLLSFRPSGGEGLDCDIDARDCGYPSNRPLRFTFDRWLLPSTTTRQSIRVNRLGTGIFVHWQPAYDVVRRALEYHSMGGWDTGFIYDLNFFDAKDPSADWGFRSYDNQLLDRTGVPEHVVFMVGAATDAAQPISSHTSCRDALKAFTAAGCNSGSCHRTDPNCRSPGCPLPVAGLALDHAVGLATAIGRVALATDRGGSSGVVAVGSERFGVNLPLIRRGEPAMSLLLYRMLLARDAYRDRDGKLAVVPPAADELARATAWLGVTGPMPPPEVGWPFESSPIEIVDTVQRWIRDGASTDDCE